MHFLCMYIDVMTDFNCSLGLQETTLTEGVPDVPIINNYPAKLLSRRGRRPSWLSQGIFRKIEQNNCFIIQQILIEHHFQNEKNYGSMMKTLKASNT